jgi:hypothetical protein
MSSFAQEAPPPGWYRPLTNGDGLRYPLEIAPLTFHVLGSGIYPVKGSDGKMHLAFGIQFANSWKMPATIKSVEVVDPAHGDQVTGKNQVLDFNNDNVTGMVKLFTLPNTGDKSSYTDTMPEGQGAVMFFDMTWDDTAQVPKAIALRFTAVTPPTPVGTDHTVVTEAIPVGPEAMVISRPFKGSGWLNGNGCCLEIGPHRFVTNAMNGSLDPSEQFAIDWMQVDEHGVAFKTDGKAPEDWYCYGKEILSVAPGTVVEVMRDMPNVAPGKNPEGLTMAQIAGNRVIVDMGTGHYAMYAHLAPNSATVHVGDHVERGQKLGLLGNSGNTTAPHLHFQVMNTPSSLDDTSLPFVFDHMQLEGRVMSALGALDDETIQGVKLPMDKKDARPLERMMPLSRDVVDFGN